MAGREITVIVGKAVGSKTVHLAEILVPRTVRHILVFTIYSKVSLTLLHIEILVVSIHHGAQGKGCIVHTCTAEELFQTAMYHAFLHISIVITIRVAAATFFFYLTVKPTELAKKIVSIFFRWLVGTRRDKQTYGTGVVAHALTAVRGNSLFGFSHGTLRISEQIVNHACSRKPQTRRLHLTVVGGIKGKLYKRHRFLTIHLLGIYLLKPFSIFIATSLLVYRFLHIIYKILYKVIERRSVGILGVNGPYAGKVTIIAHNRLYGLYVALLGIDVAGSATLSCLEQGTSIDVAHGFAPRALRKAGC